MDVACVRGTVVGDRVNKSGSNGQSKVGWGFDSEPSQTRRCMSRGI